MLKKVFETPAGENFFAGYYDKSPLDATCTRVLAQRSSFIDRMPEHGDTIEIGYFDFPNGSEFKKIAETQAWNWQQGCMLQWLGPDHASRILFNGLIDGEYRTIIQDIDTGEQTILPLPSYAVDQDGKTALCVDYDRLYWHRPGYNYQGLPKPDKKAALDPNDGIWKMSLSDGAIEKIVSIEDVMALGSASTMKGAVHYLEHIMINPAGTRFVFLHRWLTEDGGIAARMVTANIDGSDLYLLNGSGRMSHFCWQDDETVFGFGGTPNVMNALRSHKAIAKHFVKPLLPIYHWLFPPGKAVSQQVTGDCYQLFKDQTSDRTKYDRSILEEDGHPTVRPGAQNMIINDTYPDLEGDCRLFLFDLDTRETLDTVIIPSDPAVRQKGNRCDLHPKWSFDGNFVAVDTILPEQRGIQIYEVSPKPGAEA